MPSRNKQTGDAPRTPPPPGSSKNSARRSSQNRTPYSTPPSNISYPSQTPAGAKSQLESVASSGSLCLMTLDKEPVECCHVLARATGKDKKLLRQLENAWGMKRKTLNLDTSRNMISLRSDLHKTFDSGNWALLPLLDDLLKILTYTGYHAGDARQPNYLREFPDQDWIYELCHFMNGPDRIVRVVLPDPNKPQSDEPQSDEPQSDEPQSDEPQSGEPQSGEPQSGEPQSGEPQSDEPQSDGSQPDESQSGESQSGESQSSEPKYREVPPCVVHKYPFKDFFVTSHVHPYFVICNVALKHRKHVEARQDTVLSKELKARVGHCVAIFTLWKSMRQPDPPVPSLPTPSGSHSRTTRSTASRSDHTQISRRSGTKRRRSHDPGTHDSDAPNGTCTLGGGGTKRMRGISSSASVHSLQTPNASQGQGQAEPGMLDLVEADVPGSAGHLSSVRSWVEAVESSKSATDFTVAGSPDAQRALEQYGKEQSREPLEAPWHQWRPGWLDTGFA